MPKWNTNQELEVINEEESLSAATNELNCGTQTTEEEKKQPIPISRTSDQQLKSISVEYMPAPLHDQELQAVCLANETD